MIRAQQVSYRRVFGKTSKNEGLFEPKRGHSLLIAGTGQGKSTTGIMPGLCSVCGDKDRAIVVTDSKDGELCAQLTPLLQHMNRKFAVIDDFNLLHDHPNKIDLNPISMCARTYENSPDELVYVCDDINNSIIEEPAGGDEKNKYFRDEPRTIIYTIMRGLGEMDAKDLTPGAIRAVIGDPIKFERFLEECIYELEDPATQGWASHILNSYRNDKENYPQHIGAVQKALMSFEKGSTLFESGRHSTKTHFDYLAENYIIFIVMPQRRMSRVKTYCGMHLSSFKEAQLSGHCGKTDFYLDEFTNSNARELALSLTVIRSFGGAVIMAAQSRSEMIRVFGERETNMIEEMCGVKHWYALSSEEEAEKISKAIGETQYTANSFSADSKELKHSKTLSLNKDRLITPNELMCLEDGLCLTYVKGQGYILHQKIHQSELNPHSKYLGDNPMEGPAFKPNFKVKLPL